MPTNVLYVDTGTVGGGSFESLYQFLRVLDRDRFRPRVLYLNETKYHRLVEALGIPVHLLRDPRYSNETSPAVRRFLDRLARRVERYAPPFYPRFVQVAQRRSILAIESLIREHDIHLVHTNVSAYRDLFAIQAAYRAGVPCVAHFRGLLGPVKAWAPFVNAHVVAYIAYSHDWKRMWSEQGIDASKIRVLHNAIPALDAEPADLRREFGLPPSTRAVVGYVGRLASWKVDEFLLQGFRTLADKDPDVVLLIVGEGPQRGLLEETTRRLGLEGKVVFAGFREDAKRIIAGLDALVVPSSLDPLQRVVLEAMAMGTPVVATDVGGAREVIRPGENGLLMRYGDAGDFAAALVGLLGDPGLSRRIAGNAKTGVRRELHIENYARKIEQLYMGVLAEWSHRSDRTRRGNEA